MNEPIRFRCPCGSLNVLVSWQPANLIIPAPAHLRLICRDCGRNGNAPINGDNPTVGSQTWMLYDDEMRKIAPQQPKHTEN